MKKKSCLYEIATIGAYTLSFMLITGISFIILFDIIGFYTYPCYKSCVDWIAIFWIIPPPLIGILVTKLLYDRFLQQIPKQKRKNDHK